MSPSATAGWPLALRARTGRRSTTGQRCAAQSEHWRAHAQSDGARSMSHAQRVRQAGSAPKPDWSIAAGPPRKIRRGKAHRRNRMASPAAGAASPRRLWCSPPSRVVSQSAGLGAAASASAWAVGEAKHQHLWCCRLDDRVERAARPQQRQRRLRVAAQLRAGAVSRWRVSPRPPPPIGRRVSRQTVGPFLPAPRRPSKSVPRLLPTLNALLLV